MSRFPQRLTTEQERFVFEDVMPRLNELGEDTDLILFMVLARRLILEGYTARELRTLIERTAKLNAPTGAH